MYRSLEIFTGLINLPLATNQFPYYSAGFMMVSIIQSFALIQYESTLLLGGSLMALSLTLTLGTAMMVSVFVFYVECSMLADLET